MPSPLGHLLGGFAAGWALAGPPEVRADLRPDAHAPAWRRIIRSNPPGLRALTFAALGGAADLDLLVGRHSQFTHSLGMAVAVGAVAFLWTTWLARRRHPGSPSPGLRGPALLAVATAAAYGSHVLLDWLGQDATPPYGITALWPFSSRYYLSHVDLFAGISRQPWLPGMLWADTLAVARELLVLGPAAVAAWWWRGRRRPGQILRSRPSGRRQPLPSEGRPQADGESLKET